MREKQFRLGKMELGQQGKGGALVQLYVGVARVHGATGALGGPVGAVVCRSGARETAADQGMFRASTLQNAQPINAVGATWR